MSVKVVYFRLAKGHRRRQKTSVFIQFEWRLKVKNSVSDLFVDRLQTAVLISYLGSNFKNSDPTRRFFTDIVITGFNTDIDYEGVTYHVQTEDKGLATPLILSLVYDRGTILASKRSPYDDLLLGAFDEKILIERLQKQHKLICAAVRAGRIADLKRMTMKESASRRQGLIAQKEINAAPVKKEAAVVSAPESKAAEIPIPAILKSKPDLPAIAEPNVVPYEGAIWDVPLEIIEEPASQFIDDFEEEIILPAEAVEIISDFANAGQTFDSKLKIELLTEGNFRGGERRTITMIVRRGNVETGLSGAQILVKIIGSSFRPLIFHAKTDSNGVATVHLQLPHFRAGRAAVFIKAISEGEEAELRRVILYG